VATSTLRGAIAEGRVGHAYLFTGPRGTGKTTSARLLAKALNCERGISADPCGTCDRCRAADVGAEADIIEIDAATHTGVDHVRELRDQVAYAPLRARFKVYIVDEVHMLSKPAFNALLKTLEEPPPHVKFLFATTELGKVPETITSRCQIVKLVPITEKEIAARLEAVFEQEKVAAGAGVVQEIARRARGGLRDALSISDQLLSLAGSAPTLADVERLSGEGGTEELEALCDALEKHDAARALAQLPPARGGEAELTASLLEYVRSTVVVGLCGVENPFVEAEPAVRARMQQRAARLGSPRLQVWMEELLVARERMRLLPAHARVVLETALCALARPEASWSLAEIAERLGALEERLRGARAPTAAPARSEPALAPLPAPPSMTPRAAAQPAAPVPAGPNDTWRAVLSELGSGSTSLAELLRLRGKLAEVGPARVLVRLAGLRSEERVLLVEPRNKKACAQAFARVLGREIEVEFGDVEPPVRAVKDAFTTKVSDLFGGRVEDDG
jgi:DNA polymerase-3 subunit gamma/tau